MGRDTITQGQGLPSPGATRAREEFAADAFLKANSSQVVWAPPHDARTLEGVSRGYFCSLF